MEDELKKELRKAEVGEKGRRYREVKEKRKDTTRW
jgi:hypothetical protein